MLIDWAVFVAVGLWIAFGSWLLNDLLWERWDSETEKSEARKLTWLIALNLAGSGAALGGLVVLALRASIW